MEICLSLLILKACVITLCSGNFVSQLSSLQELNAANNSELVIDLVPPVFAGTLIVTIEGLTKLCLGLSPTVLILFLAVSKFLVILLQTLDRYYYLYICIVIFF